MQMTEPPPGGKPGILIPFDFSPVAEYAVAHGLLAAQALRCGICLLYVKTSTEDAILNKEDTGCGEALLKLSEYSAQVNRQDPVEITTLVRPGNLFQVVNTVLKERKPMMMIVGTHGKKGLQHLFGSYALRMVLDASCPVMVVQKPPPRQGYRCFTLPVTSDSGVSPLVDWVEKLSSPENCSVQIVVPAGAGPVMTRQISESKSLITDRLKKKRITGIEEQIDVPGDFLSGVADRIASTCSDLIITLAMPAAGATGYDFSAWTERLMFNDEGIPVLFPDPGK
jgi:nucleotide-binding universal stress UspA family protein